MIDWTKPVQTRDGQPVEIVTTKGRGSWPVKGYRGGEIDLDEWDADGFFNYGRKNPFDLINVPEQPEVIGVVNCYLRETCHEQTRKKSDKARSCGCTHIVTIYRQPDGSVTTEVEQCKPE